MATATAAAGTLLVNGSGGVVARVSALGSEARVQGIPDVAGAQTSRKRLSAVVLV